MRVVGFRWTSLDLVVCCASYHHGSRVAESGARPDGLRSPRDHLDAAALRWAAAIVRDRGHIGDRDDLQAHSRERADRRLAARPWPSHVDLDLPDTMLHRLARGVLPRDLRGVGRALARAFEVRRARAAPRDDIAVRIGDGHERVIERGAN